MKTPKKIVQQIAISSLYQEVMLKLEDSEIRNICKEKLESLEHWLRRLIDKTLTESYGDFFSHVDDKGDRLIKKKIVDSIDERLAKEPSRYSRKVDAILLDDAIDIICNPNLFSCHFKEPLAEAYPDGREVARTFMKRLAGPRNRLAHANSISLRQAEQVVCYTGDIIESIKSYYRDKKMEEEYNVPLIIKVIDSFGNIYHREQLTLGHDGGVSKDLSGDPKYYLRPGDKLTLEVEVDPSFSDDEYQINWSSAQHVGEPMPNGRKVVIEITERQVARQYLVMCNITSNKKWHRMRTGVDDRLGYFIRVLPPL